ncbi:hypothetical protein A2U01_0066638, partial [Trifolium medium]|nr:hypothetical protein [Trifolium medium]
MAFSDGPPTTKHQFLTKPPNIVAFASSKATVSHQHTVVRNPNTNAKT